MTDQLFTAVSQVAPLEPASRLGRWVLHRGGIINVWQYDQAELHFAGGRALLRGKNGAGKSKALEMLLPFLLDGDTRAIDATGRDRTTVYWLMTDGRDPGSHVGYVWLELRMTGEDGEERFFTIGAGLKAATSTRLASSWFFLAEDIRVGAEIRLDKDVSVDKLKEMLGADAVSMTGAEHRRKVASRLFGIHDDSRYRNLLVLLRRLRDPNIGERIEAGELAAVLREALPPPSEEILAKAAERFDTLEQVREQMERTEKNATVLARFSETYSGYARMVLAGRSRSVIESDRAHRRAARESARLAEVARLAIAAREEADAALQKLRDDEAAALREVEELQRSEDYKQHLNLIDRRRAVDAQDSAAASAERSAAELAEVARTALADEQAAGARVVAAREGVDSARPPLLRLAAEAGIDQGVIPHEAGDIAAAIAVATGRRRLADHVRSLAVAADSAAGTARHADEQAARSEEDLARSIAEVDTARAIWGTASRAWREAVEAWTTQATPGEDLPPVDWHRLKRELGVGPTGGGRIAELRDIARSLLAPAQEAAKAAEVSARVELAAAEASLEELESQRSLLEAADEAVPPASRFRRAERDGQAGAPFYELVDLVGGQAEEDRAGLEAALESSGLLDAWVSADGLVLHPSTQDVLFYPGAPLLPEGVPTLATVLSPVTSGEVAGETAGDTSGEFSEGRPSSELVSRLLATVALGPTDGHPWVALDGRWSVGPLRGSWRKEASEYLGASTRRDTRQRRLAELVCRCDEQRSRVSVATERVAKRRGAREDLETAAAAFPTGEEVRVAASETAAAETVAERTRSRHDADRRAAEQARTEAARRASELGHAAAADNLPTQIAELDAVSHAARDLCAGLAAWEGLWARWSELVSDHSAAAERRAQREATAAGASARAVDQRRQHRIEADALAALEEAVQSTVAAVLERIRDCERRRDAVAAGIGPATRQASDAARIEGDAGSTARAAEAQVAPALEAVEEACERLAFAAALPGVAQAALGEQLPAMPSLEKVPLEGEGGTVGLPGASVGRTPDGERRSLAGILVAARAITAQLGEVAEVSDQTVMNRMQEAESSLAGSFDIGYGESGGVKYFLVADDTGRRPLPEVADLVIAEAKRTRQRLVDREREVIEKFLLGELGEEMRLRLLEAYELVEAANRALSGVRSSHGKGAHLEWRMTDETSEAARSASHLLIRSPRSASEDDQLRTALMELIQAQRESDPVASYLVHLRAALDYRHWYRFVVQVVDDARPGSLRALSPKLGLSQGEQRVLSYLALFAAASAHFDGIGAPCPRLLLLDDAFAKVDEPTHGRLLKLLVEMNLDFMITSERMWGCFPEVPSLEIYEALREVSVPGVALVHFRWDGTTRHLVGL